MWPSLGHWHFPREVRQDSWSHKCLLDRTTDGGAAVLHGIPMTDGSSGDDVEQAGL